VPGTSKFLSRIRNCRFTMGYGLGLICILVACALLLYAGDKPPDRIPSNVEWTPETISIAKSGDAFRGLLLAKHCDHCHGTEGFSATATIPDLAGLDKFSIWKQMEDFRSHKRYSAIMEPIAGTLSSKDVADLAAYFAMLPVLSDPLDKRSFPQAQPKPHDAGVASRLITLGDGERGIPPCQACHGPASYRIASPSLTAQNADYILNQLDAFASGMRTNDIDMPMRTIAMQLTEDERQALAEYYGSGLGMLPPGSTEPKAKP